jgi:hypothetical protein
MFWNKIILGAIARINTAEVRLCTLNLGEEMALELKETHISNDWWAELSLGLHCTCEAPAKASASHFRTPQTFNLLFTNVNYMLVLQEASKQSLM